MVNEHNIEQRIFEYHEGLMDAGQKNELMEYLHQYPEYQRDFAIWAQARLHDEGVALPVFQEKLMKPIISGNSKVQKWYLGIGILCFLGISDTKMVEQSIKTINIPVESIQNISIEKTVDPLQKVVYKSLNKHHINIKNKTAKSDLEVSENSVIQDNKVESYDVKYNTDVKEMTSDDFLIPEEIEKLNSLSLKPDFEISEKKVESVSKKAIKKFKRPKRTMSLKPTSDILPTSPSF